MIRQTTNIPRTIDQNNPPHVVPSELPALLIPGIRILGHLRCPTNRTTESKIKTDGWAAGEGVGVQVARGTAGVGERRRGKG